MASLPPILPLTQPMYQNCIQIQIRPRPSLFHIIPYFLHNLNHVQPQKHPNQNNIVIRGSTRTHPIPHHLIKQLLSILKPPARRETLNNRSVHHHIGTYPFLLHQPQLINHQLRLMRAAINMKHDRKASDIRLNSTPTHLIKHLLCIPYSPLKPLLRVQTHLPTNPIQQHLHHLVQKRLRRFDPPQLAPAVNQNGVHFHVGGEPFVVFIFVENFDGEFDVAVLAERVEQNAEVVRRRFGVREGVDGLAREARADESANEGEECGGRGGEVALVHFDDELPRDVELAHLGHDVDEEGVGGESERGIREGFGVVEEGEGDFGVMLEAEEGFQEEVRGESDAVELEARLHGVERVVLLQEELRHQFRVV
ncbi:hypothetical protein CR513_53153, partial [Mucuna pruriens]